MMIEWVLSEEWEENEKMKTNTVLRTKVTVDEIKNPGYLIFARLDRSYCAFLMAIMSWADYGLFLERVSSCIATVTLANQEQGGRRLTLIWGGFLHWRIERR